MNATFFWKRLSCITVVALWFATTAVAQIDSQLEEKFNEGQSLVQAEDFQAAAEIFRQVTKAQPDFGPGWFFLGYALHMNGDWDEALPCHEKAAEFDQFAGIATYNICCVHALKGNKEQALQALESAVKKGFEDSDQVQMDSDLYSLHTDVRFARILAEMEGEVEIVKQLEQAEQLIGEEDFAKAAEIYQGILKEDRNNAFASYRLGYALHGAGNLDEALKAHTKATRFEGVAPIATYNIACVHALRDDKDAAFTHLEKAIDLGFLRPDALQEDPDLVNLRADERFQALVDKVKQRQEQAKKAKSKDA